jgi:hypothetical protein
VPPTGVEAVRTRVTEMDGVAPPRSCQDAFTMGWRFSQGLHTSKTTQIGSGHARLVLQEL